LKRFDNLHIRILLEQQDRLAELEERLEKCDDEETIQLNLSSRRQDSNLERRQLIDDISLELAAYCMTLDS
jgi:hypothetical protein